MTNTQDSATSMPPMRERVMEVIAKKDLRPKPKWRFLVREGFVWVMVCVALLVGSMATALTLYIGNASRFIEHQIFFSDIFFLFRLIPFLWLLLFGIAIFYTVHALRETRRGYRWNPAWLVSFAVGLSIILGTSAYATGVGEAIDQYLLTQMPMYKPLTSFQPKLWMNTEGGVVAGTITEIDEETFTIQMLDGELLKVDATSELETYTLETLHEGMRVRMIGTTTVAHGEMLFEPYKVEPFYGRGGGMMHPSVRSVPPPQRQYLRMKEN